MEINVEEKAVIDNNIKEMKFKLLQFHDRHVQLLKMAEEEENGYDKLILLGRSQEVADMADNVLKELEQLLVQRKLLF